MKQHREDALRFVATNTIPEQDAGDDGQTVEPDVLDDLETQAEEADTSTATTPTATESNNGP